MIRYELTCATGHAFEGWFRSSSAYDDQASAGQLSCPSCGSHAVEKALMAPRVTLTEMRSEVVMPDRRDVEMRRMLKTLRDHVVANSEDVGDRFAEEARKIHYEETQARSIRGRATKDEAVALKEEGIPFGPLPVLPDDLS